MGLLSKQCVEIDKAPQHDHDNLMENDIEPQYLKMTGNDISGASFVYHLCYFCLDFVILSCASVIAR